MGIGDWGLGIGDWGLGPIPQSPIPNVFFNILKYLKNFLNNKNKLNLIILKNIYLYYFINNGK